MKFPLLPAAAALACLLAGCATSPQKDPLVNPAAVILPPEIPALNEAGVRLPEEVKAYPINRYIDPGDPNIMHERHVIYRREQEGDWRLQANAGRQILIGNTMGDGEQELKPALLEAELARELQRQRNLAAVSRQNAALLIEKSSAMTEATQALIQQTAALRQALEQKEAENRKLKADAESEKARRRQQDQNSAIDATTGLPRGGS